GVPEALRLDSTEVEVLVGDDRPAERTAVLLLRRRRHLAEGVLFREVAVPVHVEAAAMVRVAARLGDHVDEAAGGAPELRRVSRRDDLEFLHRFLRKGEGRARALTAPDAAEERLVVVGTVDADVRVDAALTGERELVTLRVDLHC